MQWNSRGLTEDTTGIIPGGTEGNHEETLQPIHLSPTPIFTVDIWGAAKWPSMKKYHTPKGTSNTPCVNEKNPP